MLAISSGANLNFQRLPYIVERSELGEKREKILSIKIPEIPGSFLNLCKIFGNSQITEFNYRKSNNKDAFVLVGIRTKTDKSFEILKNKLNRKNFKFSDLSDNEIATFQKKISEMGYKFQFITLAGFKWNISLFHYRNLGSAFAKILVGIEDQSKDKNLLIKHLGKSGTIFIEETSNKAYKNFLK